MRRKKENGKMGRTIFEMNYQRMVKLGIIQEGKVPVSEKRTVPGYMPLNIDYLGNNVIALAHNFIQNGDVMADPDMEIRIDPDMGIVEALTYQLDSLGIFQRVYPEPGKVCLKLRRDLNQFLGQWLKNLEMQGFGRASA
jgi:hypothetical protein